MGYTTDFSGTFKVEPPLNQEEIAFLNKFSRTRRMECKQGPYYVDRGGLAGQDHDDKEITDYNSPPQGQPGLWCDWVASDDGTEIEWDGGEKFYHADKWIEYLIEHFVGPNPKAKSHLTFIQPHVISGTVDAAGEVPDDRWRMVVTDSVVDVQKGTITYA